jgi:hypothetical protein
MAFETWLAFMAASTVLLLIPGPTVLLVLSYAISQGRRVAVSTAAGVAVGDMIAMTASLLGLGALILASATAFTWLKWIGAVYLVYLGVALFLSAGKPMAHPARDRPGDRAQNLRACGRRDGAEPEIHRVLRGLRAAVPEPRRAARSAIRDPDRQASCRWRPSTRWPTRFWPTACARGWRGLRSWRGWCGQVARRLVGMGVLTATLRRAQG